MYRVARNPAAGARGPAGADHCWLVGWLVGWRRGWRGLWLKLLVTALWRTPGPDQGLSLHSFFYFAKSDFFISKPNKKSGVTPAASAREKNLE